jgi:predicted peroxiredoxin
MKTGLLHKGVLVACAIAVAAGCLAYTVRAQDQPHRKGTIVVNLTSGTEDLHAVNMALELASHGLSDDRNVIVFLNVRAPELASKRLPAVCGLAGKPPVAELISKLASRGAVFLCCPSCMDVLGVEKEDLVPEVELATKEGLFGGMDTNTVVFSY